jgi:hypothetical protein
MAWACALASTAAAMVGSFSTAACCSCLIRFSSSSKR